MSRIRFQITGSQLDSESVRLGDLISALASIQAALKQTEKIVREDDIARGYYRVIHLSRNSPTILEIEMVVPPRKNEAAAVATAIENETVSRFIENLEDILKDERPPGMNVDALEAYNKIANVLDKNVSKLVVFNNLNSNEALDLSTTYRRNISHIIGDESSAYGSVRGVLERLNIHGRQHRFYVYPEIGPRSIACEFKRNLRATVFSSVGRYVEVFGNLHYKKNGKYPYLIEADEFKVLPEPEVEELPTLWSLRGIAPQATGKLSAVEFIESIRE